MRCASSSVIATCHGDICSSTIATSHDGDICSSAIATCRGKHVVRYNKSEITVSDQHQSKTSHRSKECGV